MGLVAIPCYVTPTNVMMHFGHIVQDGYSLGAAFALIVLGAGANVGVANWLRRDYGARALLLFVSLLIVSTLVIGLTADRTIADGNATVADHTHAFDPFTRLAQVPPDRANIGWAISQVKKDMLPHETYGLAILVGMMFVGVVLRLLGDRVDVERLFAASPKGPVAEQESKWDRALSPAQLACAGAVCAIALATVGLYVFYPSTSELMDEISDIRVEVYYAVREGDVEETRRRIAQWKMQAEKLPTSRLIRTGSVSAAQRESVGEVLYSLKTLEDFVATGRYQEAKTLIRYLEKVHSECRDAFRERKLASG